MTRTALPSKLVAIVLAVVSMAAVALSVSALASVDDAEASGMPTTKLKLTSVQDGKLVGSAISNVESCVNNRRVFLYRLRTGQPRPGKRLRGVSANITIDTGGAPYGAELLYGSRQGFRLRSGQTGRFYLYAPRANGCARAYSRTMRVTMD